MEDNEFIPMRTCGICEDTVSEYEMVQHECLTNYGRFYLDSDTLVFYPVTDDDQLVTNISDENSLKTPCYNTDATSGSTSHSRKVLQEIQSKAGTKNKKTTHSKRTLDIDFKDEHLLISAVENRPPLWNLKLPLQERTLAIKNSLWEQVSMELSGKLTADEAKNKFKNLHDIYRRIIQEENFRPSGSTAPKKSSQWPHYKIMEFLRDSCLVKKTKTNSEHAETGNSSHENIENDSDEATAPLKKKKKKDNSYAMDRIADAICSRKSVNLPPPPEPDEVDSFLQLLGCRLRKLSETDQEEAMQKILDFSFKLLPKKS